MSPSRYFSLQLEFDFAPLIPTTISKMAVPNAARPGKAPPPNQARLKVVIRRLPPDLPEAVFWKSVSPWVVPHVAETTSAVEGEPGDGAGAARGDRAVVWSKYKCGKVRRR